MGRLYFALGLTGILVLLMLPFVALAVTVLTGGTIDCYFIG